MKAIIHRYKRFGFVFGSFLLLVLVVFFGTKPTIEAIFEKQRAIEEQKGILAMLSQKEALLKGIDQKTLSAQARKLDEAIPGVINLPVILATLQEIAKDSEVSLGEFSISSTSQILSFIPVTQGEKVSSFQFKVSLTGSFENMERFIDNLAEILPFLRMEQIEFAQDRAKTTISFYFQPRALVAKVAPEAPLSPLSERQMQAIRAVEKLRPPVLEEPAIASPTTSDRANPFR